MPAGKSYNNLKCEAFREKERKDMEQKEHISVLELPLICRPYETDSLNKRIMCAKKYIIRCYGEN